MPESWDARHSDMLRARREIPDFPAGRATPMAWPAWTWPAAGASLIVTIAAVLYLAWPERAPDAPDKTAVTATAATARPAPTSKPAPTSVS